MTSNRGYNGLMQATLPSFAERTPTVDRVGWSVQVDAKLSVYRTITGASGSTITIDGDLTGLVTVDETEFCIIHPSGVDPENGATQTDPCVPESRYYYGGGRYMPPIVGFEMTHDGVFGIHGAQTGDNLLGQHYMWNRFFDINTGRFTTPDPAASPFWNLQDYVKANPLNRNDPTGLKMNQVKGVHGTTYTASDAGGVKGCDVNFKFKSFRMGSRKWGRNGKLFGLSVKLEVSFDEDKCCTCKEVRLIQIVRSIKKSGKAGDKNRVFESADPLEKTRRARSGWGDKGSDSRGWRVDRDVEKHNPYYGANKGGKKTGSNATYGSSTKPAKLSDKPGLHATNSGLEFYTCAICFGEGDNPKGSILACVRWGFYISDGDPPTMETRPNPPETYSTAPKQFKDAVTRWEGLKGHEKANIDFGKK